MKKLIAFILASLCLLTASGCSDAVQYYRYDYNLDEYVELGDYRGIKVDSYEFRVTDEDMASQILLCRSRYAEIKTVDRPARMYDLVYITYEGVVDGEKIAGDEDAEMMIGAKSFIEGFEEQLIGSAAGETVIVNLTFPSPYIENPPLSGKKVTFTVKIDEVCEQELPEYNDEFVKKYYGYETVAEFEVGLRQRIENILADERDQYIITQAWEKVMETSKPKRIPTEEYDDFYAYQLEYFESLASEAGKSLSEYATSELGHENEAAFYEYLRRECENWIFEEMVLYLIARRENISISGKEYESGAKEYAEYYGLDGVAELEESFRKNDIRENILFDKVMRSVASWVDADVRPLEE